MNIKANIWGNNTLWFSLTLILVVVAPFSVVTILGLSSRSSHVARVQADIVQIKTEANSILDNGSYENINCDYNNIKVLCNDINRLTGRNPLIFSAKDKYCVFIRLPLPDNRYWCISDNSSSKFGYCDNKTFTCVDKKDTTPISIYQDNYSYFKYYKEKVASYGLSLIILGLFIFSWFKLFKTRKISAIIFFVLFFLITLMLITNLSS